MNDAPQRRSNISSKPSNSNYKHRMSVIRRKRRRQMRLFLSLFFISIVVFVLIIILSKENNSSDSRGQYDVLSGSYEYEQNTIYEFDGIGNGCMKITLDDHEYVYEYIYIINGDVLTLNFKAEEVHDATYTFTVSNNTLKLVGCEGTAGGEYELSRLK